MTIILAHIIRSAAALTFVLLACTMLAAKEQSSGAFEPFDRWYGELPVEQKMVRLDNFAVELKRDPRLLGYILVFAGKVSCRGSAEAKGDQMKRYLVDKAGISADRIVVKDGGYTDIQTYVLLPSPSRTRFASYYQPATKEHVIEECKPYEVTWPVFDTKLKIAPDSFLLLPGGYHAYIGPIEVDVRLGLVGEDEIRSLFSWEVNMFERPFADPTSFVWIRTEGEGRQAIKYGLKITPQGRLLIATKGVFILNASVYADEQIEFLLKAWRTLQSGPCRGCLEPTPVEIQPKAQSTTEHLRD